MGAAWISLIFFRGGTRSKNWNARAWERLRMQKNLLFRNAGTQNTKTKSSNAGTRDAKSFQESVPIFMRETDYMCHHYTRYTNFTKHKECSFTVSQTNTRVLWLATMVTLHKITRNNESLLIKKNSAQTSSQHVLHTVKQSYFTTFFGRRFPKVRIKDDLF